jgi:hypothetical protein
VPLLTAAVLASVPATLSVLGELGISSGRPGEVVQLLGPPYTNQQILIAAGVGLALSILCLRLLRLTGFAWTSGVLVVVTYGAALLLRDLLDQDPELQALWFLPMVLCLVPALLFERRGRPRWALPFHLVALLSLIGCLDIMAIFGPTLEMVRLVIGEPEAWLDNRRNTNLSLAATGLLFLILSFLLERARSLDLRQGARILEIAAPLHILGPLYSSALETEGPPYLLRDAGLYAGGVLLFLLLAPLGHRHRFLVAGLLGVAAALHLVLTKDLVPRAPLVVGLCALGVLLSLGTASWRLLQLRRNTPPPPQTPPREGR